MENLAADYLNFARPPLAPVFRPTEKEFRDPIAYVAKIRAEAEPYGVVKIIPPEGFKPPFAIDKKRFFFTPRDQRLDQIEGIAKERIAFERRLERFWELHGVALMHRQIDRKEVNLYKLHKLVSHYGGYDEVVAKNHWQKIAEQLKCSKAVASKFRDLYKQLILPYANAIEKRLLERQSNSLETDDDDSAEEKCEESSPATMQSGGRRRMKNTRMATRMMAGGVQQTPSQRPTLRERKSATISPETSQPKSRTSPKDSRVKCEMCQVYRDTVMDDCDKCKDKIKHTDCPNKTSQTVFWFCEDCIFKDVTLVASGFGFIDGKERYNLLEFEKYASEFKKKYFNVKNPRQVSDVEVEKRYWKNLAEEIREPLQEPVVVKYGADLITSTVGSGFPRKQDDALDEDAKLYANNEWNLNNLPVCRESMLSHIETDISGMMVPWVYVGMCFSTFCWHTEDHWTYSINYHHWGEPKVWYGIGGQQAEEFEKVMVELMPSISSASQDLFHHMTTMINPTILKRKGVNVTTVHQNAGEFVITFPRAYHAGFNEGFNFAEAVNFAPVDWLQMGRLCLNAYGSVKRHCVFSHEELVMKMACKAEQLDIGVCIATLDELAVICTEEALKRTRVKNMGIVRQHKEDLHKMEDDDRTCRICKTTMFFSAVKCKHGRISCLDHVELLCTKCRFSDMSIKYQYELPELATFIKKLEVRTIAYKKWKEEGERLLNGEKKPTLEKMEELLKATKDNRFPATRFVDEIGKIVKNCNSIKEKANLLTNGRMKTRTHTRIQRADNRFKLDELKHFIADVKKQKCDMSTTVKQLEILREKVEKWILSVAQKLNHINFDSLMVHEHEKINLHQLETLLETGENFDLQLDEIYHLKKAIDFVNWRERVMDILHWPEATDEEMKDEEYLEKKRCTAESVLRLMHEGDRFLSKDCSVLMQLHELQKKAIILDNNIKKSKMPQGKRFSSPTSSPHGGDKEKILKSLKELDWCTSEAIDDFRIDLQHQHELASLTDANKLPLSLKEHRQILEGLKGTLSKVFNTNDKLDRIQISFAQRIRFTNSMRELFKQNASYFSLGEIVAERPDWEDLSEGKAVVLKLERNKDREVTEWECCSKQGDSIEEVIKSQDSLLASKRNRLKKLQEFNRSCSDPSRTCCCMGGRIDQNVVECIVCQAKYHACCIEHDKLLYQQYPVAAYLCVRCLRGKRPEISDVKAVLREYKDFESLEIELVRKCVHSAEEAIKDLDTCRNNSSASIDDLEWSVNQVLLSETLSRADLQRVNFHTILEKTHGTILHKQDRLCKEVMNRIKPANSHLPAVLFDRSKTYKKRAGKWSSEESPKKRRRRGQALDLPALERQDQAKLEEEDLKDEGVESDGNNWDQESEEEDGCSSHPCRVRGAKKGDLTSDELVWIQCDGGCNSWFHVLCVGIHDHDVEKIEHWHCDKCAANSQIRSQMVTPPQTSSGSIKIAS